MNQALLVLLVLGGVFLGLVFCATGFLAWKAVKIIVTLTTALRELSLIAQNSNAPDMVKAIKMIADSSEPIINSLKALNESVNKFYNMALANAVSDGRGADLGAAPEDTSSFHPYDEQLAAALEERAEKARQKIPDSQLPSNAVTAEV